MTASVKSLRRLNKRAPRLRPDAGRVSAGSHLAAGWAVGGQLDSSRISPSVSSPGTAALVVEWDNVRFSEVARGRSILRMLARQVAALRSQPGRPVSVDFVVLYNPERIDGAPLHALADEIGRELRVTLTAIPCPGKDYYELKNEGARLTTGDIIAFADSDAVPEPHWLPHLLASFEDPDVCVVGGNSYVARGTLYEKAFALTWYFPERASDAGLRRSDRFLANNVAFRRSIFSRYPFPSDPIRYRSQCVTLADTLLAGGIPIHLNPRARACHPAPAGFTNFLRSALCNGHDTAIRARARIDRPYPLRATYWHLRANMRRAISQVLTRRSQVSLSASAVPIALVIACAYQLLWCLGELAARISPRLLRALVPR